MYKPNEQLHGLPQFDQSNLQHRQHTLLSPRSANSSARGAVSDRGTPLRTKNSSRGDSSPRYENAPGNHADTLVTNVYSKIKENIKSLENKYIDLANFYKESLVKEKECRQTSPRQVDTEISVNPSTENMMIRGLIQEKRDLEENMNNMKQRIQQTTDPSAATMTRQEMQRELQDAFADIFEQIDQTQVESLAVMSQKQNEMFQMATKNNLKAAFRNDSLGLWYDAKSGVAQCIASLRNQVTDRKQNIERYLGFEEGPSVDSKRPSSASNMNLSSEFLHFKQKSSKQIKQLLKVQQALKIKEKLYQDEKKQVKKLVKDLNQSFNNQQSIVHGRNQIQKQHSLDQQQNQRVLSPFEKRLMSYQNTSILRSTSHRSGSRSNLPHQGSVSANNFYKQNSSGSQERNGQILEQSQDALRYLRNNFDQFNARFSTMCNALKQKSRYEQELSKQLEINMNTQMGFVAQNSEEGQHNYGERHSVLDDTKFHELQKNNDQLFIELRKANEKYLDVRVENNKLKEQVSLMNQTVEAYKKQANSSSRNAVTQRPASSISAQRSEGGVGDHTLRYQTESLCTLTTRFMSAMRQLQKAVSRKDVDVSAPKRDFEQSKRQLEEMVVHVKDTLQQAPVSIEQQAAKPSVKSLSSRETAVVNRLTQPKSVAISARPVSNTKKVIKRQDSTGPQTAQYLKDIKSLEAEKNKLKELVTEFRQSNVLYQSERDSLQEKLKANRAKLHQFAAQCQAYGYKVTFLSRTLTSYKNALVDLEAINKPVVEVTANTLQQQETELAKFIEGEQSKAAVNVNLDPQMEALKTELVEQIRSKELEVEQQLEKLTMKLEVKEEEIYKVKLLFVEKLKELETSFVEISQEVLENDSIQQEVASKVKKELQTAKEVMALPKQENLLEKSIEHVLGKFENDEREEQIENLVQANQELSEQVDILKQQMAENKVPDQGQPIDTDMVIQLNDQIDELSQEKDQLAAQIKEFSGVEALYKKEIQGLKYDNKRMNMDFKDNKERHEKIKMEYQSQFGTLKQTIAQLKQQVQKEYEHRVNSEQKLQTSIKSLKVIKTENQAYENEIIWLNKKLEEMAEESKFLDKLKESEDASEEGDDELADEKVEQKIADSAEEAARIYSKMAKVAKSEYRDLQKASSKLTENIQDQLAEIDDLKQKLKETSQEAMNDQTRLFDLDQENQRLQAAIKNLDEAGDSEDKEREVIRKEIQAEMAPQLEFKEKEVASMTEKLSRLAKEQQDSATSFNKLQKVKEELEVDKEKISEELTQAQTTIESLRQELELTKAEQERETQVMLEKRQEQMEELRQSSSTIESLQDKFEAQKSQLTLQHEQQVAQLQEQVKNLEAAEGTKSDEVQEMRAQIEDLTEKLSQHGEEITALTSAKSDAENKLNQAKTLMQNLKQTLEKSTKDHESTLTQLQEMKANFAGVQSTLDASIEEKKALEMELGEVDQINTNVKKENELLEQRNSEITSDFEEKIDTLRGQLAKMQEEMVNSRQTAESKLKDSEKEKLERIKAQLIQEKEASLDELREQMEQQSLKAQSILVAQRSEADIQLTQLENAHERAKKELVEEITKKHKAELDILKGDLEQGFTGRLTKIEEDYDRKRKEMTQSFIMMKEKDIKSALEEALLEQKNDLEDQFKDELDLLNQENAAETELMKKIHTEEMNVMREQLVTTHMKEKDSELKALRQELNEKQKSILEEMSGASQEGLQDLSQKLADLQLQHNVEKKSAERRASLLSCLAMRMKEKFNHELKRFQLGSMMLSKSTAQVEDLNKQLKEAEEHISKCRKDITDGDFKNEQLRGHIEKLTGMQQEVSEKMAELSAGQKKEFMRAEQLQKALDQLKENGQQADSVHEEAIKAQISKQTEMAEKIQLYQEELKGANEKHAESVSQHLKKQEDLLSKIESANAEHSQLLESKESEIAGLKEQLREQEIAQKESSAKGLELVRQNLSQEKDEVRKNFEEQLQQHQAQNQMLQQVTQKIKSELEAELNRKEESLQTAISRSKELEKQLLDATESYQQKLTQVTDQSKVRESAKDEEIERLKESISKHKESFEEVSISKRSESARGKQEIDHLQRQNIILRDTVEELEEKIKSYKQQIEDLNMERVDLKSKLELKVKQVEQLESDRDELESDLYNKNEELRDIARLTEASNEEVDRIADLETLVDQLKVRLFETERDNETLSDEVNKLKGQQSSAVQGKNSWEQGRDSWGSAPKAGSVEAQVEEQLKHVRQVMSQFLSKLPTSTKENEDLLPIVFSMLNFPALEVSSIQKARSTLAQQTSEPKKKGLFGFGKKNK